MPTAVGLAVEGETQSVERSDISGNGLESAESLLVDHRAPSGVIGDQPEGVLCTLSRCWMGPPPSTNLDFAASTLVTGVQITFEEPTGSGSRSLTTNRKGQWEAVLLSAPLLYPFQFSKAGFETLVLDLQLRRPAHPQLMTSAAYEIVLPAEGTGTAAALEQGFEASYRRGVEALERDDLPVAGTELLAAILAQPEPGVLVRFSSTREEPYLPYLHLGTVDLYLGRYEDALQAFRSEEHYGAIAGFESELKELQMFRRFAQELAEAEKAEREELIVDRSLADAKTLEEKGRSEKALLALGQALAARPDDLRLNEARRRLEAQLAEGAR